MTRYYWKRRLSQPSADEKRGTSHRGQSSSATTSQIGSYTVDGLREGPDWSVMLKPVRLCDPRLISGVKIETEMSSARSVTVWDEIQYEDPGHRAPTDAYGTQVHRGARVEGRGNKNTDEIIDHACSWNCLSMSSPHGVLRMDNEKICGYVPDVAQEQWSSK